MSNHKKKLTVRGSNSAFFKDGRTHSDSQVGCPRITLLRRHGIEEPTDNIRTQKTFAIGHLNEELFVKHYLADSFIRKENEVVEPITDSVDFTGHIDIETEGMIFELKSVTSNNTWKQVLAGKPKLVNLAQIVSYMLSRRVSEGWLVYSLYAYVAGIDLPDVFFKITIDTEGEILVNSKKTGFSLEHIVLDRQTKAEVLENDIVYNERPVNPGGDKHPCFYCPFKTVCDSWDKKEITTTSQFLQKSQEVIDATRNQQTIYRFSRSKKEAEITAQGTDVVHRGSTPSPSGLSGKKDVS